MKHNTARHRGFSLLEMLIAVAIFTTIAGIVFGLLDASQQRYRMESGVLDSMQSARLAIDQITRDVQTAGYPPANSFTATTAANRPERVAFPFAWSPAYPATPCTVATTCSATGGPASFDLIIETDADPLNANGIEWIRYRLNGTTLERGVATKQAGVNPATATLAAMAPYVDNVMNSASAAQVNALQVYYPGLFPGGAPVPVFRYSFDAGTAGTAADIREVNITLILQAQNPDPRTRQPRVIALTARARRSNPSR
ncbi:MAG: type II secretion system protein [Acidobacteria bacterium]|nr:type II secretion system protein [Acidobacteriota bacterium]MBI3662573.1 type II secretion system protein [Acidobacteriota bacterium]